MAGSPVPPALVAALPMPWQVADQIQRTRAIKQLPPDAEQRALALSALEACLAYVVDAHEAARPRFRLPEQFFEEWFSLSGSLAEWMPTLSDVTPERVRDWISTKVPVARIFDDTWTTPPDAVVGAVGRMWVSSIVTGAADDLIRWFRRAARDSLTAPERARLVEVLKIATPRLPWRRTILTIPAILYLGGPEQREYFDRLANDPGLHEKTRAEAESKRSLIDRGSAWTYVVSVDGRP